MNRRQWLVRVGLSLASGSGLFYASRAVDYWLARQRAAAMTAIPTLPAMSDPIPRAAWAARTVNHEASGERGFASATNPSGWLAYTGDLRDVYHTVVIHHSAYARRQGMTLRDLQNYHMDVRHWADIGYHFGLDADGQVYTGRDIRARGASVAGGNSGVIGVAVMGHFEWESPTDRQLVALQTLVNWLAAAYDLTHLAGHNDLNPGTVCPGRYLTLYLDLLAEGAGLQRS